MDSAGFKNLTNCKKKMTVNKGKSKIVVILSINHIVEKTDEYASFEQAHSAAADAAAKKYSQLYEQAGTDRHLFIAVSERGATVKNLDEGTVWRWTICRPQV